MTATTSGMTEHRFWLTMVGAMIVLVVWGFGGSFFLRGILPAQPSYIDDLAMRPLYIVHGLAFSAWMALLAMQVGLASRGRVALHRRLGWASIIVLPVLVVTGHLVAVHALQSGFHALPPGAPTTAFFAVPALSLAYFVIVASLALFWRRDAVTHKRLIVIATMMVVGAGTTRIPFVVALNIPSFDPTQLLLLPMLWWDWRSLGRIHPATLWGGLTLLATNTLMGPIGETAAWQGLVKALFPH